MTCGGGGAVRWLCRASQPAPPTITSNTARATRRKLLLRAQPIIRQTRVAPLHKKRGDKRGLAPCAPHESQPQRSYLNQPPDSNESAVEPATPATSARNPVLATERARLRTDHGTMPAGRGARRRFKGPARAHDGPRSLRGCIQRATVLAAQTPCRRSASAGKSTMPGLPVAVDRHGWCPEAWDGRSSCACSPWLALVRRREESLCFPVANWRRRDSEQDADPSSTGSSGRT